MAGFPRVNPGDQLPGSGVDIVPIRIDVPARGRLSIEPDFRIQSLIPSCLIGPSASITGIIASSPAAVTEIRYSIDGGPDVVVSNPNTADPSFSIDLSALADGDHSITITAIGAAGQESSVTGSFQRDTVGLVTEKGVILRWNRGILQSSTGMEGWSDVIGAASPFAAPFNGPRRFWQTRSTEGPEAATLTIEKGSILTWACGVLQTSTNGLDWTDVPGASSPYGVPDGGAPAFWQVRSP